MYSYYNYKAEPASDGSCSSPNTDNTICPSSSASTSPSSSNAPDITLTIDAVPE